MIYSEGVYVSLYRKNNMSNMMYSTSTCNSTYCTCIRATVHSTCNQYVLYIPVYKYATRSLVLKCYCAGCTGTYGYRYMCNRYLYTVLAETGYSTSIAQQLIILEVVDSRSSSHICANNTVIIYRYIIHASLYDK